MNIQANLPCIKNKCLLFPLCKTKEIIECSNLVNYITYISLNKSDRFSNYALLPKSKSKKLNKIFINLVKLYSDDRTVSFLPDLDHYIKLPNKNFSKDFLKGLINSVKYKRKLLNQNINKVKFKSYNIKQFISNIINKLRKV